MMKKTLIATAVASAFSLNAFADGHVSVGGYAASGFEFGDENVNGTETDSKTAPRGGNTTLSINASNDLDNGSQSYVSLTFTTDPTIAADDVSMRAGRVGLRGDFGDVAFGMGEMVYEVGQIIDPHIADFAANSLSHTSVAGGLFNFTRIDSNVLIYSMNQIGVIKPTLVYGYGASDEVTGAADVDGSVNGATYDDSILQLALDYNNGAGLNVQFAHAAYSDSDPTSGYRESNNTVTDGAVGHAQTAAGVADATGNRITASYDTGGYIIKGTYQRLELDHAAETTGYSNDNYDGKTLKRDTMYLSLVIPVATGRIGVGYGTADDVSVDGVSLDESGSKVYSLSYQYDLSANTYLFARFGKQSNDAQWTANEAEARLVGNEQTITSQIIGLKVSF
jgi:hypothetical protein